MVESCNSTQVPEISRKVLRNSRHLKTCSAIREFQEAHVWSKKHWQSNITSCRITTLHFITSRITKLTITRLQLPQTNHHTTHHVTPHYTPHVYFIWQTVLHRFSLCDTVTEDTALMTYCPFAALARFEGLTKALCLPLSHLFHIDITPQTSDWKNHLSNFFSICVKWPPVRTFAHCHFWRDCPRLVFSKKEKTKTFTFVLPTACLPGGAAKELNADETM